MNQMNQTHKENLDNIVAQSLEIDTQKVADEILDWLIINVEQFIDNQSRMFKIDLILDGESNPPMTEARKLQALFRHIPEDQDMVKASDVFKADGTINMKKLNTKSINQSTKTRSTLNEIAQECFYKMQDNKEKLNKLYERMSFFYEMVGFFKGNALIRNINGAVNIVKFEYEAFSMDVNVKSPTYQIQKGDGSVNTIESENKSYKIDEGFTVWVEIALNDHAESTSIF